MKIAFMPDTHFGVYDQVETPAPDAVADAMDHCIAEARLAEKVGFDGLWIPERHQRPETWWPNATSLLAVLAAVTERVQLASTVIQPTFHHPIHLAESLAAVDNLSRGRLVFGAGVGYHEDYFRCFGVPFDKRGKRFEEVMDCIVGAWTEDEFNYAGEFYHYEGVRLLPHPYQKPRPPIWIGAFAPKAMERALNYEGWCLWFPPALDELAPAAQSMRERAAARNKDDFQITIGFEGWLSDDPGVRQKHGHRWVREWSFYAEKGLSPDAEATDMLDQIENMFLCLGNRQKWIDRLGEMKEKVNPDWLCIRTRNPVNPGQPYPSRTECLEVVEAFGEILDEVR
ncbi:MAG: LLM class flavin-dependent oxidoreductase [Gammaproteobacteria bacterium]|nr:LLM class flavin-dependent oxidoreductase [Gammaproteobacteria bacterium]MCP5198447.1 LLM class flavin-dependent oxidoreductase [Gammaproteobacteria bacterium]